MRKTPSYLANQIANDVRVDALPGVVIVAMRDVSLLCRLNHEMLLELEPHETRLLAYVLLEKAAIAEQAAKASVQVAR